MSTKSIGEAGLTYLWTKIKAWVNGQGFLTQHQDISGKADKIQEISHGTSDTTFTLTPNVMHIWGTVTTLTLSLPTDSNSILDEYMFTFTSGSTPTTLSLPSTVKWVQDIEVEANKTYQVSIINNLAGWLTNGMPSGGGSGGGGENNVIESISVNGVAQTVDANKNVNLQFKTINNNSISGTGNISISASTPIIEMYANYDDSDVGYLENFAFVDASAAYNTISANSAGVIVSIEARIIEGSTITYRDYFYTLLELSGDGTPKNYFFSFWIDKEKYNINIYENTSQQILIVGYTSHETMGGGGEENIIETVKVNGTALTPDANKAVDVTVPIESTVSGWGFTKNAGTITEVTGSNGLTGSGSSGSVTISHTAPSTAPTKSTSAVYPITIDQYGHITAAGSAVTIPAAPGTLKTDNTTAQTASSSEALSGTINLHKVAKTGTYSDLIGTPTIPTVPTNVSAFTNDANYVSSNNTVTIYSGSSAPSSSLGSNGDIYIQTS